MALATLQDLYVEQLQDLYSAETQLTKALPKMATAATTPELKAAFQEHLEQTEQQAQRLEQILQGLEEKPGGTLCKAMQGLVAEGQEMIEETGEPSVIDAGLIAAAQRVEHYEIAGYGCVRSYANQLGEKEAVALLEQTLAEESQTDEKLTKLAETIINKHAKASN